MAYMRMTLASFSENLKAGKYETATGARRAVGKGKFGPHDHKLAHDAINALFGEDATTSAAPATKTAKKTSTAKKTAAKTVAKKVARVAKKASVAAKVDPEPKVKRKYTKRTPSAAAAAPASAVQSSSPDFFVPMAVAPSLLGESVVRQKNATDIITALANHEMRSPEEGRCYMAAVAAATRSFETETVQAIKPQPVSFRDQLAASAGITGITPTSAIDPAAMETADKAARAITGPSYGTGGNAVAAHG